MVLEVSVSMEDHFEDENFDIRFDRAGLLAMVRDRLRSMMSRQMQGPIQMAVK